MEREREREGVMAKGGDGQLVEREFLGKMNDDVAARFFLGGWEGGGREFGSLTGFLGLVGCGLSCLSIECHTKVTLREGVRVCACVHISI